MISIAGLEHHVCILMQRERHAPAEAAVEPADKSDAEEGQLRHEKRCNVEERPAPVGMNRAGDIAEVPGDECAEQLRGQEVGLVDCAAADTAGRFEVWDDDCAEGGEKEQGCGQETKSFTVGAVAKLLGAEGGVCAAPFEETVVNGPVWRRCGNSGGPRLTCRTS